MGTPETGGSKPADKGRQPSGPFEPGPLERKANRRTIVLFGLFAAALVALGRLADEEGPDAPPLEEPAATQSPAPAPREAAPRDPPKPPLTAHPVRRSLRIRSNEEGQFELPCRFNGCEVRCCIDTGANAIVLDRPTARRVGVNVAKLQFDGTAHTANGIVRTARASIADLRVGPFELRDVPIEVNDAELNTQLLGMSFLHRYAITVSDGTLTLSE